MLLLRLASNLNLGYMLEKPEALALYRGTDCGSLGLLHAESKKGKEPRNQLPRKISNSEEGLEGLPA